MTDPRPLPSDQDLSAYLDGVAPEDVEAQVRDDPAAASRLAEIRAARDLARTSGPDPLDSGVVDTLIDRALESSDRWVTGGSARRDEDQNTGRGGAATVTPIDAHDDNRSSPSVSPPDESRFRSSPPIWMVAASVALLLAVGLGLVWNDTRSDNTVDTAASTVAEQGTGHFEASDADDWSAPSDDRTGDDDAREGDSAATGAGMPTAESLDEDLIVDLGVHDDIATLRKLLATEFPADSVEASDRSGVIVSAEEVERCELQSRLLLRGDDVAAATGTAVADGQDLLVYEFAVTPTSGGAVEETVAFVATDESCRLVTAFVR